MRKFKELTKEEKTKVVHTVTEISMYFLGFTLGCIAMKNYADSKLDKTKQFYKLIVEDAAYGFGVQEGKNYVINAAIAEGADGATFRCSADDSTVKIVAKDLQIPNK